MGECPFLKSEPEPLRTNSSLVLRDCEPPAQGWSQSQRLFSLDKHLDEKLIAGMLEQAERLTEESVALAEAGRNWKYRMGLADTIRESVMWYARYRAVTSRADERLYASGALPELPSKTLARFRVGEYDLLIRLRSEDYVCQSPEPSPPTP